MRAEAWLLASKGRWRELLEAVDAAGDGAGEYVRQADKNGYTALHRSVRRTRGGGGVGVADNVMDSKVELGYGA